MFQQIVFYIFAAMAFFSALSMVMAKNPVRAVLLLVLTFVATSGTWLVIQVEFLAIALILVYVGAVMVLFLFVVMMLDIDFATLRSGFTKFLPLGLMVPVLLLALLIFGVGADGFSSKIMASVPEPCDCFSNVEKLGMLLFTEYLYHFEIAGMLLLAAMVAAIGVTFRGKKSRKSQTVGKQIAANAKTRVKLVDPGIEEEA